jgi:hypothetical protein
MMHGHEESDSAIVAAKRTNETGRPAEEFVEPRAEAEENAEQDGTPRTPSRQGASHGLDRVRQAATLKKEERFTALLHRVDGDRLKEAYLALKREAAPELNQAEGAASRIEMAKAACHRSPPCSSEASSRSKASVATRYPSFAPASTRSSDSGDMWTGPLNGRSREMITTRPDVRTIDKIAAIAICASALGLPKNSAK